MRALLRQNRQNLIETKKNFTLVYDGHDFIGGNMSRNLHLLKRVLDNQTNCNHTICNIASLHNTAVLGTNVHQITLMIILYTTALKSKSDS